jgi:hypothetical protein
LPAPRYITTRSKLRDALCAAFPELRPLPADRDKAVFRVPYHNVLQGVVPEGSPQGYLWRIRLFSFCPAVRFDDLILSSVPELDKFWDMRTGQVFPEDTRILGRGFPGDNFIDAVLAIYRDGYRPWLEARDSPEKLLSATPIPQRSEAIDGSFRWARSQISTALQYVITAIVAGELTLAQAIVDDLKLDIDSSMMSERNRIQTLELDAALKLSQVDIAQWLSDRERFTLHHLGLRRELMS